MPDSLKKIIRLVTLLCNLGIPVMYITSYLNNEDIEFVSFIFWSILLICDIYTISELVQAYNKYEKLEYINKELLKKIK